jgi:predicted dienelactone hydrolase
MQVFEVIFLLVAAAALARLIVGPQHPYFRYSTIAVAGVALLCLEGLFGGWRWQMLPSYAAFAVLLMAVALKKGQTRIAWRLLGALPLAALVGLSALLAHFMPMVSLPEPTGPYGVGTLAFSITDPARKERYAPERNRELFVEVWYPADKWQSEDVPVRTLFQELYEGDYNRNSFLFGYLDKVDTHSHIHSPVASGEGTYPVLLFNHAVDFGFTSQNQLLMEHLASHGYVIFSIAHPYQTAKVNLANAGTTYRASDLPGDIVLPRPELDIGIVGMVYDATHDLTKVSDIKSLLYPLSEHYVALPDDERAAFLAQAIKSPQFDPFRQWVTDASVEDFISYEYVKDSSLVQYWVEDIQFIADSLATLRTPVAGFSEIVDVQRLGVFGMSYGGAAAGEFCKIDSRCDAGANLDGTQLGRHWDLKSRAPFLMLYNDEHQGGNDFAYLPSAADYWDYRIKGSAHTDFTDFAYLWPGLKKLGLAGNIDGMRMMDILNSVQLSFFDHYLKEKPIPGELFTNIPEIVASKKQASSSRASVRRR